MNNENLMDSNAVSVADTSATAALVARKELPIFSAEDLGLSIVATLSKDGVTVGDTFDYSVAITWESGNVIALIPQTAIHMKNVNTVSVKQNSAREVKDGKTLSKNEFVYKLTATDTGDVTIPEINFMVPVEGAHAIGLRTPPKSFHVDAPINILPMVVGLVVAFALVCAFVLRKRKRAAIAAKKKACAAEEEALRQEMLVLKTRLGTAESREWILSLEETLKHFASWKFGSNDLQALVKNGQMADFAEIVKLFGEARYGGGNRDQFENRETWKVVFKLMNLEEE